MKYSDWLIFSSVFIIPFIFFKIKSYLNVLLIQIYTKKFILKHGSKKFEKSKLRYKKFFNGNYYIFKNLFFK